MTKNEHYKLCLKEFDVNLSKNWKELREDEDFCDVTLACENNQIEAHKVILSASSPMFKDLLKRNPHPRPLIYLRGIRYGHLVTLLDFIYTGEAKITSEELDVFLSMAHELQIKGLTEEGQDKEEVLKREIKPEVTENDGMGDDVDFENDNVSSLTDLKESKEPSDNIFEKDTEEPLVLNKNLEYSVAQVEPLLKSDNNSNISPKRKFVSESGNWENKMQKINKTAEKLQHFQSSINNDYENLEKNKEDPTTLSHLETDIFNINQNYMQETEQAMGIFARFQQVLKYNDGKIPHDFSREQSDGQNDDGKSENESKSKFGLDPEEYGKKYFDLVEFPIPSSSKSGKVNGLPTTTSNKCGEEIKNESEISLPSNAYFDCGAEVKEKRTGLKTNSVGTVGSGQSKYNISKPFETDKNELKKKEWPLFSFGQAPVSFQDEKRIDKGETKGNLVKHQSEVKKPLLFEKKEKLDNIEPCANLASFSFVKTIKDEKKANADNNSSFASFTFVKPGDVKTEKVGPEYIETSSEDSKSVINETLKLIEEADDTKSSEIENALSSFRFVKSSIKKETLNDLGKKTVENCKDSSDQSNDPKTSDSKYFANLFNFNIPKANTVFRSIKATGSIFDQNLLDLGMKVELNDKDEREVQMKKSCFHKM